MKLFLAFALLFFSFGGFAQQSDSLIIKKKLPAFWYSVGPQYCFGEAMNVAGLTMALNFAVAKKIIIKGNAYVVVDVSNSENTMGSISNLSLIPGYRFFDKKHFFMQLHGGVSYGLASVKRKYLGENSGFFNFPGGSSHNYERDNYNYVGVPLMLTFGFTRRKIGFEISVFENFHKYPETGVSISFILGKFR